MRGFMLTLMGLLAASVPAHAEGTRAIVVELFTSEGCSSCPPADALLTELAGHGANVLPLAFHVTYWNTLGWKDPFSFEGATARQTAYRAISSQGGIYTPQMVIEGRIDVVGSDRPAVQSALRSVAPSTGVPVAVTRQPDGIAVAFGALPSGSRVWLIGFDSQHRTQVGRGENAGRTLVESNIVRSLEPLAASGHHAAPAGEHVAVLVQAADGRMLGAATAQ